MQEKIARKYLDHKYKCDWDAPENLHWIEWKEEGLLFAQEILSLPVEGCDCTLGELPEQVRKMRGALQMARNVLVTACGETAPYIKIALQKIDDALTFKGK